MKDNPYVGPRPYERRHSQNFYGRNREARDLLSLIIAERVVLFYAQSGAGKSSLLNAKVIPELEKENFLILPVVRVGSSLPPGIQNDDVPNIFMFSVLLSLAGGNVEPAQLCQHTLLTFLREFYPDLENPDETESFMGAVSPLLVVDQFEELFTTHRQRWNEAPEFFDQIREALEAIPRLGILFAMREDYVAELDPYAHLLPRRMRARFRMNLLSLSGALEAIAKPAENRGIHFSPPDTANDIPGAAEWLRDELRRVKVQRQTGTETVEEVILGPFVEPVQLQVVCNQLWENLPEQDDLEIDLDEVRQYGDVDRALVDFYESSLIEASEKADVHERDLRHWFSEQLLTPMHTRGLALRGSQATAGLSNDAVDVLQDKHIIRPELRAGARWYELAHDRLIAPVLQSNQAWEEARQTPLRVAARRWSESQDAALLYRDKALKQALSWTKENDDEAEPYEHEFLKASQAAERRRAWRRRVTFVVAVLGVLGLVFVISLGRSAARSGMLAYAGEQAAQSQHLRNADQKMALEEAYEGLVQEYLPIEIKLWSPFVGDVELLEAEAALRLALVDYQPSHQYKQIGLGEEVNSLVFSHDNRYLYGGLSEGQLWIWNKETELGEYVPALGAVRSLALHPKDPLLAIGGDDGGKKGGDICLWNTEDRVCEQFLKLSTPDKVFDDVYALSFSANGRYLAAGGDYGEVSRSTDLSKNAGIVRIWDLDSNTPITLTGFSRRVTGVSFNADDDYLVTSCADGTIKVWETRVTSQGALTATAYATLTAHTAAVLDVKFSPNDATLFASASEDKTVRLWRITPEDDVEPVVAEVTLVSHSRDVSRLAFTPNGDFLLSGSRDGTALLWETRTLNPNVILRFTGHTNMVMGLAFSSDNRIIATGDGSGEVRIWDRDFLRRHGLSTLSGQNAKGRGVAYTPDGRYLVSGDDAGVALIWDLETAQVVQRLPSLGGKIWNLLVSHNGDYLVTCTDDGDVYVWNPQTGEQIAKLEGHEEGAENGAFSPDDRYLVTGADDQRVLVWDTTTWKQIDELKVPNLDNPGTYLSTPGEVWGAVAYSPNGQWIAVGFTGGRLQLWAVDTSQGTFSAEPAVTVPNAHGSHIMSADFSPDSLYLATGGFDNHAKIWEVQPLTLTLVDEPMGHGGYVYDVLFSPDGEYLATGSRDQMVRLWDMSELPETPEIPLATLPGHTDLIWSLAFSPDGKYLASNSWDRSIRRFLVEIEDVEELVDQILTVEEKEEK